MRTSKSPRGNSAKPGLPERRTRCTAPGGRESGRFERAKRADQSAGGVGKRRGSGVSPIAASTLLGLTLAGLLALTAPALAHGGHGGKHPHCEMDASNKFEDLDVEMLAARLPPVPITGDSLHEKVVKLTYGEPDTVRFARVIPMRHGWYAVAWEQCIRSHCRGYVALVEEQRNGTLKRRYRSLLPYWYDADDRDGVEILNMGLLDVDGTGDNELLIEYQVNERERPGTGREHRRLLGIWDPRTLRLLWIYETDKGGEGRSDPRCDGVVELFDINCDRRGDIQVRRQCNPEHCFRDEERQRSRCRKAQHKKAAFRWRDDSDLWVGFNDEDRLLPYDDNLPWLTIAGTFAVASTTYDERAEKHRDKLIDAGFKDATVYNSRVFRLHDCCHRIIVVGRFKTKEEAQKLRDEVKGKGFNSYVRKGF